MKFTTPVAMKVTYKQYKRDLEQPLKEMGYKWESYFEPEKDFENYPFLTTSYEVKNIHNCLGGVNEWNREYKKANVIEEYNPELFLALAAMNDSNYGIKGEYWKFKETSDKDFTKDKIYEAVKPLDKSQALKTNTNSLDGYQYVNLEYFVKATKEEIINHFKNKNMQTINDEIPGFTIGGSENLKKLLRKITI